MLERRKEKRTRRTIQLIAIPLIVLIGGYLIWNTFGNSISPAEPTVTAAPTNTSVPVDTPTPAPPDTDNDGLIDAEDDCPELAGHEDFGGCPHPDTWDLNVEFEDWQKRIVLEDLQVYWTAFMSPVTGTLPDCELAIDLLYSQATDARESVVNQCAEMVAEQVYFVNPPLNAFPEIEFYNFPDDEFPHITVTLFTVDGLLFQIRYISDGGLKQELLSENPQKFAVGMTLEDGTWKVYGSTLSEDTRDK